MAVLQPWTGTFSMWPSQAPSASRPMASALLTMPSPALPQLPPVRMGPHITHNLLFVRRFTTDNSCSIEFDPSVFW
jgi:hypothetical protein